MSFDLASFLPKPKNISSVQAAQASALQQLKEEDVDTRVASTIGLPSTAQTTQSKKKASMARRREIPPQGLRRRWIPRVAADFGGGGAYPEIHVLQYPLGMGKDTGRTKNVLSLQLTEDGEVSYESLVTQGGDSDHKFTYVRPYVHRWDFFHVFHRDALQEYHPDEEDVPLPTEEEEQAATERTKAALEMIVNGQSKTVRAVKQKQEPTKFIKYTPGEQGVAFNSGASQRVLRMVEKQKDPMDVQGFKAKKIPRAPPSPPVPIMHSPTRKMTAKEKAEWKIPPCISNWKNRQGHVIGLDKRLAADGRGLMEVTINDNFAKLSESLYIAERQSREEISRRAAVEAKLQAKAKQQQEDELRTLAAKARTERSGIEKELMSKSDVQERERIRQERRHEIEREKRMERMGAEKRSKLARDKDRDISEKIALGMAAPSQAGVQYDSRLFNQESGMDSGFGAEDDYNIYTNKLFGGGTSQAIYRPRGQGEEYGTEEDLKKLKTQKRFEPDRGFEGTEGTEMQSRSHPVEFTRDEGHSAKRVKKKP